MSVCARRNSSAAGWWSMISPWRRDDPAQARESPPIARIGRQAPPASLISIGARSAAESPAVGAEAEQARHQPGARPLRVGDMADDVVDDQAGAARSRAPASPISSWSTRSTDDQLGRSCRVVERSVTRSTGTASDTVSRAFERGDDLRPWDSAPCKDGCRAGGRRWGRSGRRARRAPRSAPSPLSTSGIGLNSAVRLARAGRRPSSAAGNCRAASGSGRPPSASPSSISRSGPCGSTVHSS